MVEEEKNQFAVLIDADNISPKYAPIIFQELSPFRNLRVNGYLLLTAAYRSLSRLSSALSAKASTLRSSSLDRVVIRSTLFGSCEQQPHHVSRLLLFRKNGIFAGHDNTGLYDCVSFSFSFLRLIMDRI